MQLFNGLTWSIIYDRFKLPVHRQREDSVNAIGDCIISLNVWLQVFFNILLL